MRTINKITTAGLVALILGTGGALITGTSGCGRKTKQTELANETLIVKVATQATQFEEIGNLGGGYNTFAGGSGIAAGDMDNDGDIDIVVADRGATLHYLENMDGRFADRGAITTGRNMFAGDSDVAIVDIDKDRDLDILYTDRAANVYFVRNTITDKK